MYPQSTSHVPFWDFARDHQVVPQRRQFPSTKYTCTQWYLLSARMFNIEPAGVCTTYPQLLILNLPCANQTPKTIRARHRNFAISTAYPSVCVVRLQPHGADLFEQCSPFPCWSHSPGVELWSKTWNTSTSWSSFSTSTAGEISMFYSSVFSRTCCYPNSEF